MTATSAKRKTHRLDGLTIKQVAGVDWPAHLQDGWAVLKAVSTHSPIADALAPGLASRIFRAGSFNALDAADRADALELVDALIDVLEGDEARAPEEAPHPADITMSVNDLWQHLAEEHAVTDEVAEVLYGVLEVARAAGDAPATLTKAARHRAAASELLERQACATFPDLSFAKAVSAFMATPAGQRAYELHENYAV